MTLQTKLVGARTSVVRAATVEHAPRQAELLQIAAQATERVGTARQQHQPLFEDLAIGQFLLQMEQQ